MIDQQSRLSVKTERSRDKRIANILLFATIAVFMYNENNVLIVEAAQDKMREQKVSAEEILLVMHKPDEVMGFKDRATLTRKFDNRVVSASFYCVSSLRSNPLSDLWCLVYDVAVYDCSISELYNTTN